MPLDGQSLPASKPRGNFDEAVKTLNLNPQEQYLYQHHLNNLYGPGKVVQPNGDISTMLQANVRGPDGQHYNIPTVWYGRVLPVPLARSLAARAGWDKWPAYPTAGEAERRYNDMHQFMDRDVQPFMPSEDQAEDQRPPMQRGGSAGEKVGRDAFLYEDPRRPDGKFAQCETCRLFLPHRKMCAVIGIHVAPEDSCGLYVHGTPTDNQRVAKDVSAKEAGFVRRQVRCENCKFFKDGHTCGLYVELNTRLPNIFDLDTEVEKYGCCNAQTPIPGHASGGRVRMQAGGAGDQPPDQADAAAAEPATGLSPAAAQALRQDIATQLAGTLQHTGQPSPYEDAIRQSLMRLGGPGFQLPGQPPVQAPGPQAKEQPRQPPPLAGESHLFDYQPPPTEPAPPQQMPPGQQAPPGPPTFRPDPNAPKLDFSGWSAAKPVPAAQPSKPDPHAPKLDFHGWSAVKTDPQTGQPVSEDAGEPPNPADHPSVIGAGLRSFFTHLAPSAAGMWGFARGYEAGSLAGALVPLPGASVAGGLIGGFAGMWAASEPVAEAQDKAINALPDNIKNAIGMSEKQRALDYQEHPYATMFGDIGSQLVFMRPGEIRPATGPETATQRWLREHQLVPTTGIRPPPAGGESAFEKFMREHPHITGMALMAGQDAGQRYLEGQPIDVKSIAMDAATGALLAHPTRLGTRLMGFGAEPASKTLQGVAARMPAAAQQRYADFLARQQPPAVTQQQQQQQQQAIAAGQMPRVGDVLTLNGYDEGNKNVTVVGHMPPDIVELKHDDDPPDAPPERLVLADVIRRMVPGSPGSRAGGGDPANAAQQTGATTVTAAGQTAGQTHETRLPGAPTAGIAARAGLAPGRQAAGFRTEQGSTYQVNDYGQTIRTKRSPGVGQGLTYPPHNVLYVTPDVQRELLGKPQSMKLGYVLDNQLYEFGEEPGAVPPGGSPVVVRYDDGEGRIGWDRQVDMLPAYAEPQQGLHPVESRHTQTPNGPMSTLHVGNRISEVFAHPATGRETPDPYHVVRSAVDQLRGTWGTRVPTNSEIQRLTGLAPVEIARQLGTLRSEGYFDPAVVGPIQGTAPEGIAFVMSQDTRRRLRELGYTEEQIRDLTPSDALGIIRGQIRARPVEEEAQIVAQHQREAEAAGERVQAKGTETAERAGDATEEMGDNIEKLFTDDPNKADENAAKVTETSQNAARDTAETTPTREETHTATPRTPEEITQDNNRRYAQASAVPGLVDDIVRLSSEGRSDNAIVDELPHLRAMNEAGQWAEAMMTVDAVRIKHGIPSPFDRAFPAWKRQQQQNEAARQAPPTTPRTPEHLEAVPGKDTKGNPIWRVALDPDDPQRGVLTSDAKRLGGFYRRGNLIFKNQADAEQFAVRIRQLLQMRQERQRQLGQPVGGTTATTTPEAPTAAEPAPGRRPPIAPGMGRAKKGILAIVRRTVGPWEAGRAERAWQVGIVTAVDRTGRPSAVRFADGEVLDTRRLETQWDTEGRFGDPKTRLDELGTTPRTYNELVDAIRGEAPEAAAEPEGLLPEVTAGTGKPMYEVRYPGQPAREDVPVYDVRYPRQFSYEGRRQLDRLAFEIGGRDLGEIEPGAFGYRFWNPEDANEFARGMREVEPDAPPGEPTLEMHPLVSTEERAGKQVYTVPIDYHPASHAFKALARAAKINRGQWSAKLQNYTFTDPRDANFFAEKVQSLADAIAASGDPRYTEPEPQKAPGKAKKGMFAGVEMSTGRGFRVVPAIVDRVNRRGEVQSVKIMSDLGGPVIYGIDDVRQVRVDGSGQVTDPEALFKKLGPTSWSTFEEALPAIREAAGIPDPRIRARATLAAAGIRVPEPELDPLVTRITDPATGKETYHVPMESLGPRDPLWKEIRAIGGKLGRYDTKLKRFIFDTPTAANQFAEAAHNYYAANPNRIQPEESSLSRLMAWARGAEGERTRAQAQAEQQAMGDLFTPVTRDLTDDFRTAVMVEPDDNPLIAGAAWTLGRGLQTNAEHMAVIDPATGRIFATTDGAPASVAFPVQTSQLLQAPGNYFFYIHNHPSARPASAGDVGTLALPGIEWAAAISHEGLSAIRLTEAMQSRLNELPSEALRAMVGVRAADWLTPRADYLKTLYKDVFNKFRYGLTGDYQLGDISRIQFDRIGQDMILRIMDAAGLIDHISSFNVPVSQRMLDMYGARSQAQFIRQFAHATAREVWGEGYNADAVDARVDRAARIFSADEGMAELSRRAEAISGRPLSAIADQVRGAGTPGAPGIGTTLPGGIRAGDEPPVDDLPKNLGRYPRGMPRGPLGLPHERALSALPLMDPSFPARPHRSSGVREIAQALETRARRVLQRMGVPDGIIRMDANGRTDPRHDEILARVAALEVMEAARREGHAGDWYDGQVRGALRIASLMHPELAVEDLNDPRAPSVAFRLALAVTSQNEGVTGNVRLARAAYKHYWETGRFPTDIRADKGKAMNANFAKLNDMLDDAGGNLWHVQDFLMTPRTVGELKRMGHDISGENVNTPTHGSVILGPKIGGGFYQNLNGNFDPTTFDLWFMRTWGRLTGRLIGITDQGKIQARNRFENAWRNALTTDQTAGPAHNMLEREDYQLGAVPQSEQALMEKAAQIEGQHERDFDNMRALYDSGARKKSELVKAATAFINSRIGIKEQPEGGNHRNWMRRVWSRAREILDQNGFPSSHASMQALVWYPEKVLYGKLGGRDPEAINIGYADALANVARQEGVSDEAIREAMGPVVGRPGPGPEADITGTTRGPTEVVPTVAGEEPVQPSGGADQGPLVGEGEAAAIARTPARDESLFGENGRFPGLVDVRFPDATDAMTKQALDEAGLLASEESLDPDETPEYPLKEVANSAGISPNKASGHDKYWASPWWRFLFPSMVADRDPISTPFWQASRNLVQRAAQFWNKYRSIMNDADSRRLSAGDWKQIWDTLEVADTQGPRGLRIPMDGSAIVVRNDSNAYAEVGIGQTIALRDPRLIEQAIKIRKGLDETMRDGLTETARKYNWHGDPNAFRIQEAIDRAQQAGNKAEERQLKRLLSLIAARQYQQRISYLPHMRTGDYAFWIVPKIGAPDLPGIKGFTGEGVPPKIYFGLIDSKKWWYRFVGGERPDVPDNLNAAVDDAFNRLGRHIPGGLDRNQYTVEKAWLGDLVKDGDFADPEKFQLPALHKLMIAVSNPIRDMLVDRLQRTLVTDPKTGRVRPMEPAEAQRQARDLFEKFQDKLDDTIFQERTAGFRRHRENIPGYNQDWGKSVADYLRWTAHHNARIGLQDAIDAAWVPVSHHRDESMRQFWTEWKRRQEEYNDPFYGPLNIARQYAFHSLLGMNAASTLKIILHAPMRALPMISTGLPRAQTALTHAALFRRGMASMARTTATAPLQGFNFDPLELAETPEERALVQRAMDKNLLHPHFADEMKGDTWASTQDPTSFGQRKAMLARILNAWSSNITAADRLNRATVLLTAYRMAQRVGMKRINDVWDYRIDPRTGRGIGSRDWGMMDEKTPESWAEWMVQQTNQMGGDFNSMPFTRNQFWRTLFMFHNYEAGYLSSLWRMATRMGPEGRMSALLMLGGLAMLGGVFALPFAKDIEEASTLAWNTIAGLLGFEGIPSLEGEMHNLTDALLGNGWGDVLLHGPPRELGVDMQGIGFGDLISRYTESPLDYFGAVASSAVNQPMRAIQRFSTGQDPIAGVRELLPNSVKHMLDAMDPSAAMATARTGTPYLEPGQLSMADHAKMFFGFTPAIKSETFERNQRLWLTRNGYQERVQSLENRIANLVVRGQDPSSAFAQAQQTIMDGARVGVFIPRQEMERFQFEVRNKIRQRQQPGLGTRTQQRMQALNP